MPSVLQRYPRFILLLTFILVCSFLYYQPPYASHVHPANYVGLPSDPSLPSRVQRAEKAYQKVVEKRQVLLKKHGPSPSQVVM